MNVFALLQAIAPKLFDIVDQAIPDKDLAVKVKADLSTQMLDNQSALAKAGSSVVIAEAQGESWLQRNWRPMVMLFFCFLLGAFWFGFVPVNMPLTAIDSLFTLLQIGIGGYVVGRSGEKIAKAVGPALANRS